MNFKPMLSADASDVDLSSLRYPLLVSPKLDGVRCIIWEGIAYSRNAKPIRNKFVQAWAKDKHNLDGELIVGSPTEGCVLNRTQSGVMSFDGEPNFAFHLFDCIECPWTPTFVNRLEFVQNEMNGEDRIVCVEHQLILTQDGLTNAEQEWLDEKYEGVMLRDPNGPYKHGRSTMREGYLMKLKRFMDGEAIVIGLEEGQENCNVATKDELGRPKRSRDASGMQPNGMVGTILVNDPKWGELRVAPSTMSHSDRVLFLQHPKCLIGKTIHWRSFGYGVKDKPRFPRFYGLREDI